MSQLHVTNVPKLTGIALAMVLLTGLIAIDRLSESGYLGLMGLLVGYLVGNGVAAHRGDPVQPVIGNDDS